MTEFQKTESSRSFTRTVLAEAFRRPGAKIGLAWILLLVLFAVFAPVIANSYPLLMSVNDEWSSPFWIYLTATDIWIFVIFVTVLSLFFIKLESYLKFYITVLVVLISVLDIADLRLSYVLLANLIYLYLSVQINSQKDSLGNNKVYLFYALMLFVFALAELQWFFVTDFIVSPLADQSEAINELFSNNWWLYLIIVLMLSPFAIYKTKPVAKIVVSLLLLVAAFYIARQVLDLLLLAEFDREVTIYSIVTILTVAALFTYSKLTVRSVVIGLLAVISINYLVDKIHITTPQVDVYDKYREAESKGEIDWTVTAPIAYSPKDYLRDYGYTGLQAPLSGSERVHVFGTEESGSDVLSRMIHASRIALAIGFVATGIALIIGIIIGGLMGYFSGAVDMFGMRLMEIFEAIPVLYLLLTFVAFFGPNIYMMMVIIGVTSWPGYARYIRAEFLKLRSMDFVQSAKACGLPLQSILFRHMLPNGVAPVLVAASFGVASAILVEAILSFLGLGLVDEASWGSLLNQAVQAANFYWWLAFFPGGAIFFTVLAYNMIGEALRDAIDPYLKKRN